MKKIILVFAILLLTASSAYANENAWRPNQETKPGIIIDEGQGSFPNEIPPTKNSKLRVGCLCLVQKTTR